MRFKPYIEKIRKKKIGIQHPGSGSADPDPDPDPDPHQNDTDPNHW